MNRRSLSFSIWLLLIVGGVLAAAQHAPSVLAAPGDSAVRGPEVEVIPLVEEGGRPDWSHALNVIAYDRLGADGYYDVHLITPDGLLGPCMTCNHPNLPNKNIGNPAWHPNGQFLVIQVEKAVHDGTAASATPGLGINNDIWLLGRDGSTVMQVTDVAEGMGVLHPHFSRDGRRLVWAERVAEGPNPSGIWVIRVLSFEDTESLDVRSASVTTYMPMGPALYETHGFSPDGSKIVFTAHDVIYQPNHSWLDIYTLELDTGALQRLTFSPYGWDEHAHYTLDGQHMTWISSRDCNCFALPPDNISTELYLMNADGTGKLKLTALNDPLPPDAPRDIAADHSGPSGTSLVLYVQKGEETRPLEGRLVRVDLSPELFAD